MPSEWIFEGLKQQHEKNIFHFAITLRSFIEYTRRGMWFLCWANTEKLKAAMKLTFESPGSPGIATMDEMINEALGKAGSPILWPCRTGNKRTFPRLSARTYDGIRISVRMISFGLDNNIQCKYVVSSGRGDFGLP